MCKTFRAKIAQNSRKLNQVIEMSNQSTTFLYYYKNTVTHSLLVSNKVTT